MTSHIPDASKLPLLWTKSRHSGNTNCVECADAADGAIYVRDSKIPSGPALLLGPAAWTAFLTSLQTGAEPRELT